MNSRRTSRSDERSRSDELGQPDRALTATKTLHTIGYELGTVPTFLATLRAAGVETLVDVRAAARSRRPGFAKTRLAANLHEAGIRYLHLPALGTPAEGRAAARAGKHGEMQDVFREHLKTEVAQEGLSALTELVASGQKVCLLCLEAEPEHCHRSLVAEAINSRLPVRIVHLEIEGDS